MLLWPLFHWPKHVTWLTQGTGGCNLQRAQKEEELWIWVSSTAFAGSFMKCLLCAEHWEEKQNSAESCSPIAHLLMGKDKQKKRRIQAEC